MSASITRALQRVRLVTAALAVAIVAGVTGVSFAGQASAAPTSINAHTATAATVTPSVSAAEYGSAIVAISSGS